MNNSPHSPDYQKLIDSLQTNSSNTFELGVRDWSTFPTEISAEQILYDASWTTKWKLTVHQTRKRLADSNANRSILKWIVLAFTFLIVVVGIAVGLYLWASKKIDEATRNSLVVARQQVLEEENAKRQAAQAPVVPSPAAVTSASQPVVGMPLATDPNSPIEREKTLPDIPEKNKEIREVRVASTPSQISKQKGRDPQAEREEKVSAKPMLAIEMEPQERREKTIAKHSEEKVPEAVAPTKTVGKVDDSPKPRTFSPMPVYQVLAITKNGIVISDPDTKLPKQFTVGMTMPSGEVVKSVNADQGIVTTDVRIIRLPK